MVSYCLRLVQEMESVYATLRGHLSSALKSAELVQVALEAEAKAIKADQLKTHLLANVSHELRTPINIILGLSQIALSFTKSVWD